MTRVGKLLTALNGLPAGSYVYVPETGTGGGTVTPPVDTGGSIVTGTHADFADSGVTFAVSGLRAAPASGGNVLTWTNTDPNTEVTSVTVTKNGTTVATLGKVATWTDPTAPTSGTASLYSVRAANAAGKKSETAYDYATFQPAPAGTYSVNSTKIQGPAGQFIPLGANIGVNNGIGGNSWSDEKVSAHTKEAADWGWNTIRLSTYVTRDVGWIGTDQYFVPNKAYTSGDYVGQNGRKYKAKADFTAGASFNAADWTDLGSGYFYGRQAAINDTFTAAQKYVDAGFVVILTVMDITQGVMNSTQNKQDDIADFVSQASLRFKDESRVWMNINEPIGPTDQTSYTTWNKRFYDLWRANGNNSIYIADVMTNAQDAPWGGTMRVYDSNYGPAFLSGRSNVVFGLHNYGGQAETTDAQSVFDTTYSNYFTRAQQAGLCMGLFEAGYTYDAVIQATPTNQDNRNIRGFRAQLPLARTLGIGLVAWDGSFDRFSLKRTTDAGGYNGQGFWYQGASGDLSNMGAEFWNLCRATLPLPAKPPAISDGGASLTTQTVTWLPVVGAATYDVEWKLSTSSTWNVIKTTNGAVSYTVNGLTGGTRYDYRVRGRAASGTTDYSPVLTASTGAVYQVRQATTPSTTAQPAFWLKYENLVGKADGSTLALSDWRDTVGNVSAAAVGAKPLPTVKASHINGLPGVEFDCTQLQALYFPFPLSTDGRTIFIVATPTPTNATVNLLQGANSDGSPAATAPTIYCANGNGTLYYAANLNSVTGQSSVFPANNGGGISGVPRINRLRYTGSGTTHGLEYSLDGNTIATVTSPSYTSTPSTGLGVGASATTTAPTGTAKVVISEIIIFNTALSGADQRAWTAYLGKVYGMPVGSN